MLSISKQQTELSGTLTLTRAEQDRGDQIEEGGKV